MSIGTSMLQNSTRRWRRRGDCSSACRPTRARGSRTTKSFALGHLAQLVATMPGWITTTIRSPSSTCPRGGGYSFQPTENLVAQFDKHVGEARDALAARSRDVSFAEPWSLQMGDRVLSTLPRGVVVRYAHQPPRPPPRPAHRLPAAARRADSVDLRADGRRADFRLGVPRSPGQPVASLIIDCGRCTSSRRRPCRNRRSARRQQLRRDGTAARAYTSTRRLRATADRTRRVAGGLDPVEQQRRAAGVALVAHGRERDAAQAARHPNAGHVVEDVDERRDSARSPRSRGRSPCRSCRRTSNSCAPRARRASP